jgi:hypothetical protein
MLLVIGRGALCAAIPLSRGKFPTASRPIDIPWACDDQSEAAIKMKANIVRIKATFGLSTRESNDQR